MRLITSSLRSQLFAAFAAVIVVFGIGIFPYLVLQAVFTSSLRTQLLAAFAAVIVVFGIGVVVSISSLSGVSNTLQNGTARVKLADTLSKDTYNMQGSQLMATLNNGASAKDHEGDARKFAAELAILKPLSRTMPGV